MRQQLFFCILGSICNFYLRAMEQVPRTIKKKKTVSRQTKWRHLRQTIDALLEDDDDELVGENASFDAPAASVNRPVLIASRTADLTPSVDIDIGVEAQFSAKRRHSDLDDSDDNISDQAKNADTSNDNESYFSGDDITRVTFSSDENGSDNESISSGEVDETDDINNDQELFRGDIFAAMASNSALTLKLLALAIYFNLPNTVLNVFFGVASLPRS